MRSALLIATAIVGLSTAVEAAPIASGSVLNIVGNANFNDVADVVSFTNPANLVLGGGDFSALGTCVGCVTMSTPLDYGAFVPGVIYSASNVGFTTAFTAVSLVSVLEGPNTVALNFSGVASLTGADDTAGLWVLTVNQFGSLIGSFSATTIASAVPEPASLALLGAGLLGLGMARRKFV